MSEILLALICTGIGAGSGYVLGWTTADIAASRRRDDEWDGGQGVLPLTKRNPRHHTGRIIRRR